MKRDILGARKVIEPKAATLFSFGGLKTALQIERERRVIQCMLHTLI